MFGQRMTLFTLLGFKIQVDLSWVVIAVLITWSLAKGFFPETAPGLDGAVYWRMGVTGALGLFASIILHELSHAVVARLYGMRIRSITLFIFGGVAEMEAEPPSARAEFRVAVAGPAMSLALAVFFYALASLSAGGGVEAASLTAILHYLAVVNGVLAVFNLVPAFPLDGGRAFRAFVWARTGSFHHATQQAARLGGGLGLVMIGLGVLSVVSGNFIGGLWWLLIGLFMRNAAGSSYVSMIADETFTGAPVTRFMTADPVTVSPHMTVEDFVHDIVYPLPHEFYPVVDGGRVLGGVTSRLVKMIPKEQWPYRRVGEIVLPVAEQDRVAPDADAQDAMKLMSRTGQSRLLVVDQGRLVGLLTLKDMLTYLTLKIDLEED